MSEPGGLYSTWAGAVQAAHFGAYVTVAVCGGWIIYPFYVCPLYVCM
jgi:hypothetical protein